ncbi:MAG: hypothetical protein R6V56_07900 [Lentisphaeria bacterium]
MNISESSVTGSNHLRRETRPRLRILYADMAIRSQTQYKTVSGLGGQRKKDNPGEHQSKCCN